jgi:hypothetical protein
MIHIFCFIHNKRFKKKSIRNRASFVWFVLRILLFIRQSDPTFPEDSDSIPFCSEEYRESRYFTSILNGICMKQIPRRISCGPTCLKGIYLISKVYISFLILFFVNPPHFGRIPIILRAPHSNDIFVHDFSNCGRDSICHMCSSRLFFELCVS